MPRNAETELIWMRRIEAAGKMLAAVDAGRGCKALTCGELDEIRILLPGEKRGDVLVVLKGHVGEQKFVAFVGGPDAVTAMLMWRAKETAAGVKWREDAWKPPEGWGDGSD